jgi:uncharacterized protein YbjQ (UPF0145 family)
MICPNCGCEQREAGRCIQCQMTLPGLKEAPENDPAPPLSVSSSKKREEKSEKEREDLSAPEQTEKETRKPQRKGPIRVVEPERRDRHEEGAHKILITTTQKIEGRKVKNYFGLINANIIIELDDPIRSIPEKTVYSTSTSYRSHLKTGVLLALRDLRGEAALFGANAVVGTSFNFHRIDPRSLLLSAVGTAVLVDEPN